MPLSSRQSRWSHRATAIGVGCILLSAGLEPLQAIEYASPLTGQNKVDWFVANFKDHGDGTVQRDYMGGFQSYIGHGGMDIWPYDYKAMDDGIRILAAAPGTVTTVRDQVYEMWPGVNYMFPSPYIVIRHADGTQALYYHIRHGSATVTNGQTVTTGQPLALMGPHLHFEVQDADGISLEIMTNQAGQVQNFGWFDSYSNQVLRQVLSMGVTKTNDWLLTQNLFEQTPRSYSRIHSGPFTPWIKYVGQPKNETLTIRLVAESGPGWSLDLTDWPMQWIENLKWWYCYWFVSTLVDGTTYRLQYRWNSGEWTDAPGDPFITVDDAADEEYVSRYSPHYTRYVAVSNRTPQTPYTSWATAANTIQAAIDVSQDGDLVMVSNGVYEAGGTIIQGTPTRVAVTKGIAVQSANGPHVTIIKGQGPAGADAVRCAYVKNGSFLSGFTLTDGAVCGQSDATDNGGGALCDPYGGVINCIISDCSAVNGGGAWKGILNNCLVVGNTATSRGGGTDQSEVAYSTIEDNTAGIGAGGSWGGYLFGCIAWCNTASNQTSNFEFGPESWVWYSCTTPAAAGYMNITNDPQFVNQASGDYHLSAGSPCIDHGAGSASWALDIDHGARIVNFATDMGAFEYTTLPVAPWWITAGDSEIRRIRVQWNAAPRATGYCIWRYTQDYRWSATTIGSTTATHFDDTQAVTGVTYYYWVQATNAAGVSPFSITAAGRRLTARPGQLRCDFDGDGARELAVFNPISGDWYAMNISNTITLSQNFGGALGAVPLPDDYDGDGIADVAVYIETTGQWGVRMSGSGGALASAVFGGPGWTAIPLDYDGDGKADPAVYCRADGTWRVMLSGTGYSVASLSGFGGTDWEPAPGDYDGDRKADPGLYNSALPFWAVMLSGAGYQQASTPFGAAGYVNVSADYDGDGKQDPAIYGTVTGAWLVLRSGSGYQMGTVMLGGSGYIPVPGDYDGDSKADLCLYQPSTGLWAIMLSGRGYTLALASFGGSDWQAVGSAESR